MGCAYCINDNGQIVGTSGGRATLFDPTGSGNNLDLGTLGGTESGASFINESGQIVGWAESTSYDHRATLFDPTDGGNNIDLNTLIDPACGWTLDSAFSINDNGWIVGQGTNPAGEHHAYLLISKPPTTYYVDADAIGANDGSSWPDAFNYLQDALTAAWSGDEIWGRPGHLQARPGSENHAR